MLPQAKVDMEALFGSGFYGSLCEEKDLAKHRSNESYSDFKVSTCLHPFLKLSLPQTLLNGASPT